MATSTPNPFPSASVYLTCYKFVTRSKRCLQSIAGIRVESCIAALTIALAPPESTKQALLSSPPSDSRCRWQLLRLRDHLLDANLFLYLSWHQGCHQYSAPLYTCIGVDCFSCISASSKNSKELAADDLPLLHLQGQQNTSHRGMLMMEYVSFLLKIYPYCSLFCTPL